MSNVASKKFPAQSLVLDPQLWDGHNINPEENIPAQEYTRLEQKNNQEAWHQAQGSYTHQQSSILGQPVTSPGESGYEPWRSPNGNVDPPSQDSKSELLPAENCASASPTVSNFKPKKSLRFTFLTIGSRGDVQPFIALAKGLIADGHRAKIATYGVFQPWIESHGIEFGYIAGDPTEMMCFLVECSPLTLSFWKERPVKFYRWREQVLRTCWEACKDTDVLVDTPLAIAGYHIAEALQIPYFRASLMPMTRTRAYPHPLRVPPRKLGGFYNYMTYVVLKQTYWWSIAGQVNRWRRDVLHLDSTSIGRMETHKTPSLCYYSPTLAPCAPDWPKWNHVTGFLFLDNADAGTKKWTPPQDLVQFINSARQADKKVVYIGFGSIVVSDPRAVVRCVVDAVVQSGVYAIFSKGWLDRLSMQRGEASEPEEPLPEQIYSISSIPHDWLFSHVDAVCHHGGIGTTGISLRAGIPIIIKPFFADQFFWANRIEELGVGIAVRKLTIDGLSQALTLATTDQKLIERARRIGEQIRSEDGLANAIEAIYRDLDYARSLIKRPSHGTNGTMDFNLTERNGRLSDASTISHCSGTQKRGGYVAMVIPVLPYFILPVLFSFLLLSVIRV